MTSAGIKDLAPRLDRLDGYLSDPSIILVGSDAAEALAGRVREIKALLRAADDRVCLGLVGGTGVGKSTLINALAGENISAGSDLRPTTDHLVLYRHQDNDFSLTPDEETHIHQAAPLARISLADFPDFDSIEEAHRRILAGLFSRLDLLVWVVDPVKYADQALFDWLDLAPQARINQVFVFNKIDDLERRYGDDADRAVQGVILDFKAKLARFANLENPDVFPMSALNSSGPGFQSLVGLIAGLMEEKHRRAVKDFNLAAMASRLEKDVLDGAGPDQARAGLDRLRDILVQGRAEADEAIQGEARRFGSVLGKSWRKGLAAQARSNAPWPLDFFLFIWDHVTGLFRRKKDEPDKRDWPNPEPTVLLRRMKAWQSRAAGILGPQASPAALALRKVISRAAVDTQAEASIEILDELAQKKSDRLARTFRRRIRHHLLPLIILIIPFIPMITALVNNVDVKWSLQTNSLLDYLYYLAGIAGVYLVETVYFAYKLDRAAGKGLTDIAQGWSKTMSAFTEELIFQPIDKFADKLAGEIEQLDRLAAGRPKDNG